MAQLVTHILRNCSVSFHPGFRLTGNKKSLSEPMERGVDMRSKLIQLYKDHYLASRMKLTVLGGGEW